MLYRDEKLKRIVNRDLQNLWETAKVSKKRTCLLGGLATLAWVGCLTQLSPIQQAKSIVPHLAMIVAAQCIAKTTKDSLNKTEIIQKRTIALAKELRLAQNSDELHQIHQEISSLEKQFVIKSYRVKD